MAYNLSISMQHDMGLSKKQPCNQKSTRLYRLNEWKTLRFLIVNRAGRITWEGGKKVLKMTYNKATKELYDRIRDSLNQQDFKMAA